MGPPSDVYSFGVVLFEWLAGRRPFEGTNVTSYIFMHTTEQAPPLLALAPATPPELAALVERCLEKTPYTRPTAAELGLALAAIADALDAPAAETLVDRILTDGDGALSTAPTATGQRQAGG